MKLTLLAFSALMVTANVMATDFDEINREQVNGSGSTSGHDLFVAIGQINHLFATKPKYHLPFLKGPTASLL